MILKKIFYSDNGSTAVEVSLKMAIQYCQLANKKNRKKIIALKNSYHGDTFGSMSVSERGIFTLPFADFLFEVVFLDPNDKNKSLVEQISAGDIENAIAFIYEPLVQGAGGMNFYDKEQLNDLVCKLKQNDVICIADEVMTGFGRTGNFFASEYLHHKPDIICLSKGITGGALPLAVTACTQKIYDAFLSDDFYHTFFHGHSYTANPIACAAALASLDLLTKEECIDNIAYISEANSNLVNELKEYKELNNVRSLGTILAYEFFTDKKEYLNKVKEETMLRALQEGIFLRPLGNTVYIMPPYAISPVQLEKVHAFIRKN